MNRGLTGSISEVLLECGPTASWETYEYSLHSLPPGRKILKDLDCDGFIASNDCIADQALSSRLGPVAVKYRDYRSPVIEMASSGKYRCPLNEGIYASGELNWRIPNFNYSEIKSGFPEVPNHDLFIRVDSCQQEMPGEQSETYE